MRPTSANRDGSLTVAPGGEDGLPQGAERFRCVRRRLSIDHRSVGGALRAFDLNGKFLRSWQVGIAADRVKQIGNDLFLICQASTGEMHAFDSDGRERLGQKISLPRNTEVQLKGPNRMTVHRPAAGDFRGGRLAIQFEKPQSQLICLEGLDTEASGNSYVAWNLRQETKSPVKTLLT